MKKALTMFGEQKSRNIIRAEVRHEGASYFNSLSCSCCDIGGLPKPNSACSTIHR
jgi:hypothetical protein